MARRTAAVFALVIAGQILLCQSTPGEKAEEKINTLHAEAQQAEAAGDLAAAAGKYQAILKLSPGLGPAYNNLGVLYIKQGRYRDAADILERGLKVNPGMHSASALLGMALFHTGDYGGARPRLEAAVAANPTDRNAALLLADDLTKLGDFEAAAAHLEKLTKLDPRDQQLWYLLGKVYMQLSEGALGKINQIDPNSVWAHEISAELMESMKNYDGAIVEWKKAVEAAPQQPGLHYKLADLYWGLSQWENATEQFQQELAIDPGNCRVEWKLGDVLLQKSVDTDQALAHVEKALAACPNLIDARADRGRLLMKLHREREALPDLLAAEEANPAEPSTHFLLAQVYRATGKAEQAQAEMKLFGEWEQKARNNTAERAQEVIKNSESAH